MYVILNTSELCGKCLICKTIFSRKGCFIQGFPYKLVARDFPQLISPTPHPQAVVSRELNVFRAQNHKLFIENMILEVPKACLKTV